mgnify:CR=1 FL=1
MTAASANKVTVPGDNRLDELKLGNKTPFWHKIPIIKELRVAVGWQKGMLITGLVLTAFFLLVAIFAPLIAPYSYAQLKGADGVSFPAQAAPSSEHIWGTTAGGYDVFSRVVWGARTAVIAIVVAVLLSIFAGVLLGLISGYFGGWVDGLIMRIVDVFYCIPSMPIIIIIGSAMDAMKVDSWTRMVYLMLILGFLGWPGIARLVRGQILSLREQEFMTATEACGISVSRRIFRHLIPNVIPQLIVNCTMSLGATIITEATLSFLGLGVKFPFASWGNIMNDVSNSYVLTSYWFIWIPAGICLMLTVLGFNFVGDGLRDAFDPKMKR